MLIIIGAEVEELEKVSLLLLIFIYLFSCKCEPEHQEDALVCYAVRISAHDHAKWQI